MRKLTWTETTDFKGRPMWSTKVGRYYLRVTATAHPGQPFYGAITADYGSGPVFEDSGCYKTAQGARTGLTRRLEKYRVD